MKNLIWSCSTSDTPSITVGQKFSVFCNGPLEEIDSGKLEFKRSDAKEEVPTLTLLNFISNGPSGHELVVTSYKVGEHKSEDVYLSDGQNSIQVQGVNWKVTSVLSQNPLSPPEPFPAFPAWQMSYPIWFWFFVVLFFMFVFGLPIYIYKKVEARKRAYDSLKDLETVFEPIDQLFRDIRKIEKKLTEEIMLDSAKELEKEFRLYLARSLQIPFQVLEDKKSFKDLKRKHFRIYRDFGVKLKKYFFELTSIDHQKLTLQDFLLLINTAQKLSEGIESYLNPRRKT